MHLFKAQAQTVSKFQHIANSMALPFLLSFSSSPTDLCRTVELAIACIYDLCTKPAKLAAALI